MTDQELLEAAAKAAGINAVAEFTFACDGTSSGVCVSGLWNRDRGGIWNPLANDGDALRLAVRLDIEIYQGDDDGRATFAGYWAKPERRDVTRMFCIQRHEDSDPCSATRRAIVHAAALASSRIAGQEKKENP